MIILVTRSMAGGMVSSSVVDTSKLDKTDIVQKQIFDFMENLQSDVYSESHIPNGLSCEIDEHTESCIGHTIDKELIIYEEE